MNKSRKHFNQDYLIEKFRSTCEKFGKKKDIDVLASALAIFVFKHPSLLEFDEAYRKEGVLKSNLKNLFKCSWIPSDTQMRARLDEVENITVRQCFKSFFQILQRGKILEEFVFYDKTYLVSIDGTGYFSSSKIHCDNCCQKHHKNGSITYQHQMLTAALVHPKQKVVFPFAPEMIQKQDGESKNDCERNAFKRWIDSFRKDHPLLKITVVADGLHSNAPMIRYLTNANMSYIIVAKNDDHKYLFDWFENGTEPEKKTSTTIIDGIKREYFWMNDVLLNDSANIKVNVIRLQETKQSGKISNWAWVTNHKIDEKNVAILSAGGRSRWKIENETFNTLKNQGYNFEHNYGHGYKNLSYIFAHLVLLAFFMDQILQKANISWQGGLNRLKAKYRFWEKIRNFIDIIAFKNFESLYSFIWHPPKEALLHM